MRRPFAEDLFGSMTLGLLLGLFYGSLRAFFFYDTIGYFAWGFKEIGFAENISLKLYIICFYFIFGAIFGIILRFLYRWVQSLLGRPERRFTIAFVSILLCFYSFLNVFVYVNYYKFLLYWGEKIYFGNLAVRKALVTPLVIITNTAIIILFIIIGWTVIRVLNAIDARWKGDKGNALIFSLCLGYFVYFSLLTPVNNRMPYLTAPASIMGNVLLIAVCFVVMAVAYYWARSILNTCRRKGQTFIQYLAAPLPRIVTCTTLALALTVTFHCVCVMESPGIKYLIYVKAPREIIYSLFYLNKVLDFDHDGYSWVSPLKDLDHFDNTVHPMAVDIPFNGIDEDGVGGDMTDRDLDGYEAPPYGNDCDDTNPAIHPGAIEVADGRDNNCDGVTDNVNAAIVSTSNYSFDSSALDLVRKLARERDLNIFIILMDALAADHMSCYGYSRPTTPNIDAFAKKAILFKNTLANSTGTEQSLPSIILSQYPSTHRLGTAEYWRQKGPPAPLNKTFSPLQKDDFILVYLSATRILDPLIDAFSPEFRCDDSIRDGQHKVRGDNLNTQAFSLMKSRDKLPNLFLLLHYYDNHWRYTTPRKYADYFGHLEGQEITYRPRKEEMEKNRQYMIARYDGGILYADHLFGQLMEHLRSGGQYENSIIVIISDHGEQFLQHGGLFHNMAPYREVQYVPFIMRLPEGKYGGVTIEENVQLLDLMPTLFDLLGLKIPQAMEGKSLLPLIASKGIDLAQPFHRFIFAETENYYKVSDSSAIAIQDNETGYKYIFNFFTGEEELYDIKRDPFEKKNIKDDTPEVLQRLKKVLFNFKSSQEKKYRERVESMAKEGAPR